MQSPTLWFCVSSFQAMLICLLSLYQERRKIPSVDLILLLPLFSCCRLLFSNKCVLHISTKDCLCLRAEP